MRRTVQHSLCKRDKLLKAIVLEEFSRLKQPQDRNSRNNGVEL